MKKSLIASIAVALVAFSANAASIQWTISGLASKVLKDYQGNTAANATVYFILADDLSSLSGNETQADFETALAALTLSTATTTSEGKKPTVSKRVVSDNTKLVAGTEYTFGLLAYSKDADGNGYYTVTTASKAAYDPADPTSAKEVQTSFATLTSTAYTSAWTLQQEPVNPDDPTPGVPEPATGALALAGVALLFKRRRA